MTHEAYTDLVIRRPDLRLPFWVGMENAQKEFVERMTEEEIVTSRTMILLVHGTTGNNAWPFCPLGSVHELELMIPF